MVLGKWGSTEDYALINRTPYPFPPTPYFRIVEEEVGKTEP